LERALYKAPFFFFAISITLRVRFSHRHVISTIVRDKNDLDRTAFGSPQCTSLQETRQATSPTKSRLQSKSPLLRASSV
jgi:hypothetical protein